MTDRDGWVGLGNDCNLGCPHKHHWKTCQSTCTTRQATFPTRHFSKVFSRDIFKTLDRLSVMTTSCDYTAPQFPWKLFSNLQQHMDINLKQQQTCSNSQPGDKQLSVYLRVQTANSSDEPVAIEMGRSGPSIEPY